MRTLITFLGKGRKQENGYRTADYLFESGQVRRTAYFGLALLQELIESGRPVERLVVMGTSSSIWGALLGENMADSDLWYELEDRQEKDTVDQQLLDRVSADAAEFFVGLGVHKLDLRLIPFGRDEAEQVAILQAMAACVQDQCRLVIDVSHGFRHLPMLGLVSALFLMLQRHVKVEGLYYGALEMRQDGRVPVLRLDGLLRLGSWLVALGGFRAGGDYGLFAPLLQELDPEVAGLVRQTAFREKVLDVAGARKQLKQARQRFAAIADKDPVFRLLHPELEALCSWSDAPSHHLRQLAAARAALATGNHVRAAALGIEAIISAHIPKGEDPQAYKVRKLAREDLNEQCKGRARNLPPILEAYRALADIRNALAHGTRITKNTFGQQTAMEDEKQLRSFIDARLDEIENHLSAQGNGP